MSVNYTTARPPSAAFLVALLCALSVQVLERCIPLVDPPPAGQGPLGYASPVRAFLILPIDMVVSGGVGASRRQLRW